MIYLDTIFNQQMPPAALPAAVRGVLGRPLRRAAGLTQLALTGALNCLPANRRHLPTALLWQSTSGPLLETLVLLEEICNGDGEPMPYDFLASQPALAAAQLQPHLPGLQSASHFPLADERTANWQLLLTLASQWLHGGRYEQVLCAQLDHWPDASSGHWLSLSARRLEKSLASLQLVTESSASPLADTPTLPVQLAEWLASENAQTCSLPLPASSPLALEFARL